MSISTKLNVLNETVQELQQIVPDLFTRVTLQLQTLSLMESITPNTSQILKDLSSKLITSSHSYFQVQQLQLQKFMAQQIYHQQYQNNMEQIDQYSTIFDSFSENLYSKEGVLLDKRGLKLSKKNKALMSQMQIKFQNDLKLSNMEYQKFQRLVDDHYQVLAKYNKDLQQYKNDLKRRVQTLEWTVINKSQSYRNYLNSEEMVNSQPVMDQIQRENIPVNFTLKGNKENKNLSKDLVAMLVELKEENQLQLQKLREQRSYTHFLSEQFQELSKQFTNNQSKSQGPKKLTSLQRLERKKFLIGRACSVESL